MQDELRVEVGDGKYTVVFGADCRLHALRYGEQWRDCVGDNLILALAQEVRRLRQEYDELSQAKRESERDLIAGLDKQDDKVCQILAQAVGGYPYYKDDLDNFPTATEADGVCYGDHVPETPAREAATEIARLRKQVSDTALEALSAHTQAEEAYQKQLAAEKRVKELEELCVEGGLVIDPN